MWVEACNTRDAAAASALYAEDAVNTQFAAGPPVTGRHQIAEGLDSFFRAFPDNTTKPISIFNDGQWVVLEWVGTGTWKGAFFGQQPTGRAFSLRGCGIFRVEGGLIREQRGYWDRASWFGQIGIPLESL